MLSNSHPASCLKAVLDSPTNFWTQRKFPLSEHDIDSMLKIDRKSNSSIDKLRLTSES
jgi:hypothetical protein